MKKSLLSVLLCLLAIGVWGSLKITAEYVTRTENVLLGEKDRLFLSILIFNSSPKIYYEKVNIQIKELGELEEIAKIDFNQKREILIEVTEKRKIWYGWIRYTFCEGDLCLLQEEELEIRPNLLPAWMKTIALILFGGLTAVAGLILWKKTTLLFTIITVSALCLGLAGFLLNQQETVQSIASTLCASCIGLETVPERFLLEAEYIGKVAAFPPFTVEVYHTDWCKSCPVVIEFLEELSVYCENMRVELYDAEQEEKRAREKGIYSGNSLVVPSVIVSNQKRIIGAERFPDRLLTALEALNR